MLVKNKSAIMCLLMQSFYVTTTQLLKQKKIPKKIHKTDKQQIQTP